MRVVARAASVCRVGLMAKSAPMNTVDRSLRLHPPAKVNLVLKIFQRLPNGYHALWSLMQTIGVADDLTIRVTDAFEGIRLTCSDAALVAPAGNVVYRAAELVLRQSGASVGVALNLTKRVPVAAGLGGGSSDAAATIVGLNHLLGLGWTNGDMAKLGQAVGSDVPFFIDAPTAIIQGWGERVMCHRLEDVRWIVLVNPGFPIQTGQAYGRLAESGRPVSSLPDRLLALERAPSLSWRRLIACLENDFETVLCSDYPVLADIKKTLLRAGAEGALVSGSGSTVFGVFPDERSAMRAKDAFVGTPGYRLLLGPSLQHGLRHACVAPPREARGDGSVKCAGWPPVPVAPSREAGGDESPGPR